MTTTSFARLIPLLTVIVIAFAIFQLYNALMFAVTGQYAFAAFYGVFGFAGFALARALWIHRRKLMSGP
jgi:uncharacterized membrane protein YqjE